MTEYWAKYRYKNDECIDGCLNYKNGWAYSRRTHRIKELMSENRIVAQHKYLTNISWMSIWNIRPWSQAFYNPVQDDIEFQTIPKVPGFWGATIEAAAWDKEESEQLPYSC